MERLLKIIHLERHIHYLKYFLYFGFSFKARTDKIIVINADIQKRPLSYIMCPLLKAQIQSVTRNVPMVAGVITRRSANVLKATWGSTARLLCVTHNA
jgi:type III secretory pathway component EscU